MEITVSVKDLLDKVREMSSDGMNFVTVSILEADTSDPDDPLPACLHFEAARNLSDAGWPNHEEIDAVN